MVRPKVWQLLYSHSTMTIEYFFGFLMTRIKENQIDQRVYIEQVSAWSSLKNYSGY